MESKETSKTVYKCPHCRRDLLVPLNFYRRIVATAGQLLGGASGGTYLGWSFSYWIGILGLGIGLPTAIGMGLLGGLAGATVGGALGGKAGDYLDKYLVEEYKCLGCHLTFKKSEINQRGKTE